MSENKKPVKVFKKIKHKRPAAQPVKLPPAMSEPDIADADIEALLADNSLEMPNSDPDIRNIARQTAAPQQPAPVQAAPAPAESEEDEFERLLNEFISAELDDVEEEVENAKNGQAPTPQISLPISNSDDENSAKLNEGERSLYRAYQNYFYAVRAMAESADRQPPAPSITAENLYPHFKPKTGRRISQDILNGWDIMLKIFPQELASLNPAGTDVELLDFAERASDDNLQLAIISYVEILIEIEGCELNYAERKLKAERRKIERQMYEEHQARVERSQRYIEAIRKKEFPIDAERLVKNFFKTSNKDAEGAYKMLTNNPATFAPIEINKIKPRLFGLIKVTPQDGIRVNREIGDFIKKLKA